MSETATHEPQRTVLHDLHVASGAQMVDIHGWKMPLRYQSIPEEHLHVRRAAGLFDLGHMGRFEFIGEGVVAWLQRVLTADVSTMRPGQARYTLILNEHGGVIDDAILYSVSGRWILVANASNAERVGEWIDENRPDEAAGAKRVDLSEAWAMIALQGAKSAEILEKIVATETPYDRLGYYNITRGDFDDIELCAARTGYTGEDGFEIYLPSEDAETFWQRVVSEGGDDVAPIGLGARDTLRLEAGMPLYGNELDESTTPYHAGLGFAVKLDKRDPFIGRDALKEAKESPLPKKLRGFQVDSKRVARQGMKIFLGDDEVGVITSGAPSPTLGVPVAMGYIETNADRAIKESPEVAANLAVDLRGKRLPLIPTPLPFYSRTRKKKSS
ncbi:MAG: glycine cleavage system aminomethyltransferase GcvT [Planctomycetota bacterium]